MPITNLDRPTLLQIAAEAYVDPRSVRAEIAYQQGLRTKPVSGLSGERIRAAMARRGLTFVPEEKKR